MKYLPLPALLLSLLLIACESNDRKAGGDSTTDIDAARDFIRASLDGNFKKARNFMIGDSANEERMNLVERVNQNLSPDEKKGLAASSINIHNVTPVNDTTTVVIYSNSFKNNWDTLRVIKQQEKWLVDFVYLWEHDKDTLVHYKQIA